MNGVLTTSIMCGDAIGVAMNGVGVDLGSMSVERQRANVREQSHEGQREHDRSQLSPPQHHRGESIGSDPCCQTVVRIQLPHRTSW